MPASPNLSILLLLHSPSSVHVQTTCLSPFFLSSFIYFCHNFFTTGQSKQEVDAHGRRPKEKAVEKPEVGSLRHLLKGVVTNERSPIFSTFTSSVIHLTCPLSSSFLTQREAQHFHFCCLQLVLLSLSGYPHVWQDGTMAVSGVGT